MSAIYSPTRSFGREAFNLSSALEGPRRGPSRITSDLGLAASGAGADEVAVTSRFSAASQHLAAQAAARGDTGSPKVTTGALKQAAEMLARMKELKALRDDAAASESDLANYDEEFTQLQSTFAELGGNVFRGRALAHGQEKEAETSEAPEQAPGSLDHSDTATPGSHDQASEWLEEGRARQSSSAMIQPRSANATGTSKKGTRACVQSAVVPE